MDHTPFIWASYSVGAVVFAWTAFSPLLRKKKALANIKRLKQIEERSNDANP